MSIQVVSCGSYGTLAAQIFMVMFGKDQDMWDLGLLNGTGKNQVEASPIFQHLL